MQHTTFDDFRDVMVTAAGTACRCNHSQLPGIIANLIGTSELWSSSRALAVWPNLAQELGAAGISVRTDSAPERTRDQPWGITTARGAIAESGSVILHESTLDERSVSLMTEKLIVLCPLTNLHASLDDAARILREIGNELNSYATLVSGPSRTADIERQLTIGVQGPSELHVIFVEDSSQTGRSK